MSVPAPPLPDAATPVVEAEMIRILSVRGYPDAAVFGRLLAIHALAALGSAGWEVQPSSRRPEPLYGPCGVCDRRYALTDRGLVRRHHGPSGACPGGGRQPGHVAGKGAA